MQLAQCAQASSVQFRSVGLPFSRFVNTFRLSAHVNENGKRRRKLQFSDRQLEILQVEIMGARHFNFVPRCLQNGHFRSQILYF